MPILLVRAPTQVTRVKEMRKREIKEPDVIEDFVTYLNEVTDTFLRLNEEHVQLHFNDIDLR